MKKSLTKETVVRSAIRCYTTLYIKLLRPLGLTSRGLGVLQRKLQEEDVLEVDGYKYLLNPMISDSYGVLLGGYFNEPATHMFMNRLVYYCTSIVFIDAGCNIGEFIITMGVKDNVNRVIGYDIHPECVTTCRRSVDLNNVQDTCNIFFKALGADKGTIDVNIGNHSPTGTNMFDEPGLQQCRVEVTTLDEEMRSGLFDVDGAVHIILMDVEGYEHQIMEGAKQFIWDKRPVIIFEYNDVSRKYFNLDDVRSAIGDGYEIYRLNRHGSLDVNFDETWNCVAIPKNRSPSVENAVMLSMEY